MTDMVELETGLLRKGHRAEDGDAGPIVLGDGNFRYRVSGDNWGRLPEGWVYREATAVAVDGRDRVFVFNRGTSPMAVFDTDGNLIDSWGKDIFVTPHGISIGPDGNLFCVDVGNNTIKKVTPEGRVLMNLGEPNQPSERMSNVPFSVPTQVGVDPRTGE